MKYSQQEITESKNLKSDLSNELFKSIIMMKQESQEERVDELLHKVDNLNFKVNNFVQSEYNYIPKGAKYAFNAGDEIMKLSEENRIIQEIITEVEKIKELDDIQDQIASCACVSNKCLKLLRIVKRNGENNQRKSTMHLFFQAIKRNYAKKVFTNNQIDLMILMLMECQNEYIGESKYFEFDEKLYKLNLSVFPEEE